MPPVQTVSDGSACVGDGHHCWAYYSRFADTSTNDENAELVALFSELGQIERTMNNNIISIHGMMPMMTQREIHIVLCSK